MHCESEQRLDAELDAGAAFRCVIDRVRAAGGAGEIGRGKAVDRLHRVPAEQVAQRFGKRAGGDRVESAFASQERCEPFVGAVEQDFVVERYAGIRGAVAQRLGAVAPS